MNEFKHSWRYELPADAQIWLLSKSPERSEAFRKALVDHKFGNLLFFDSVEDTFEALQRSEPTLLVIDAENSPEEGIELLKDLRSNPRLPNIPVIPILMQKDWDNYGPKLYSYNVTQALIPPFHGEDIAATLSGQYRAFRKNGLEQLVADARCQFQQENFESAGKLFAQAREMRRTMSTEVGLASALAGEGKFAAAQKITKEAKTLDADSFELQLLGLCALINLRLDGARAQALVKQSLKKILPLCLYEERALRLFGTLTAKPEVAMLSYKTFEEDFSRFPSLVYEAAKVCFALSQEEQSLQLGKLAYEKGLRKIELLNLLGVLYKRRHEPNYSLLFYTEAIRLMPEDYRLHFNKGLCLEEMHKPQEAASAYSDCLQRAPEFARAHDRLDALKREFRKGA